MAPSARARSTGMRSTTPPTTMRRAAPAISTIAERMVALRPKRSIIFIWDSGEEQGLWGTRYFVANPPVPLEKIVAHFNIDMIGANRAPGSADASSTTVTGPNEVYLVGPGVLARVRRCAARSCEHRVFEDDVQPRLRQARSRVLLSRGPTRDRFSSAAS